MKQILIFRFLQCRDSVQLWQETLGDIASQPAKGVSPHKWPRSFSHSLSWFFFFFFLTGVLFPARRCRPLRGIDQPSSALRQICLSTCLHASSKSHEGQQSRRVRHCREQGLYQVVHLCVCVCVCAFRFSQVMCREDVKLLLSPKSSSKAKRALVIILYPLSC